MEAVSVRMEGPSPNDSIFSLLDHSWFSESILKHSWIASGVQETSSTASSTSPGAEFEHESETVLNSRSSEEDSARRNSSGATECSTLQSVDDSKHTTIRDSGYELGWHSIDESEMRRVFDRLDSDGDGLISGKELHRYLIRCWTDVSDAEANSMISCVDLNNDGSVDFEEFLLLYNAHSSEYASEADSEEDDQRSRENNEQQHLLDVFRVFDRNDDGFISAQELQAVLLDLGMPEGKSLLSCEAMIRVVDRDGDGQCDIREFQEMMARQSF